MRFLCAPYSGASATVFRPWVELLPSNIALSAVELPGRGSRFSESPLTCMEDLIDQLYDAVRPHLRMPFVLFGHSLGAVVMFELAHRFVDSHLIPERLIVSGQRALHRPSPRSPIHNLPDEQFISEINQYGGTQAGIFENEELRSIFLPLLRADFQLGETYVPHTTSPLCCDLSAYGGLQDPEVSVADIQAWRRYTEKQFNYRMFPGNHFFLHQHNGLVVESLLADLSKE
ncbi:MAG: alpha/beta fold hydrolase [Pirellulaceae bacterium]